MNKKILSMAGFMKNRLRKYAPGHNKGFTLIEMLVVIAIIAILVAIIMPVANGAVQKARQATCWADMRTLSGEYSVQVLLDGKEDAFIDIVDHTHKGKVTQGDGKRYTVSGFCPSGGVYTCHITNDGTTLSISCNKHGAIQYDITSLASTIAGLDFSALKANGFPYANLNEFFRNSRNDKLNSEAKSTGGYGQYGSFANAVQAKLTESGFDIGNRTWRIDGDQASGAKEIYLADRKLDSLDAKEKYIRCDKYNITTGKIESGYIMVSVENNSGGKFPILESKTFTTKVPDNAEVLP